ncbi:MAG: ABC transporter ATP-binding protein [Aggregatilineales bacterium]
MMKELQFKDEKNQNKYLIELQNLKVYFELREGTVRAVDGVSFAIEAGKTLGVVGESGCGKSVTSEAIMRLIPPPGTIIDGKIILRHNTGEEVNITNLKANSSQMRQIRGNEISKIFQEPMTSLSPVHTIGNQISEVIILHQKLRKTQAKQHAIEMLRHVGIPKPEDRYDSYPFELSGGMRQRAMIAMALACNPSLLIADEPTTALDVTTEAQILDLMRSLQTEFNMAILFISHNLGVIAEMADNVVVMYMGKNVEYAATEDLFYRPAHPYTLDLLRSIPRVNDTTQTRLYTITGNVPDPYNIPKGCSYHPRCSHAISGKCDVDRPVPLFEIEEGHHVRCWLYEDYAKVE